MSQRKKGDAPSKVYQNSGGIKYALDRARTAKRNKWGEEAIALAGQLLSAEAKGDLDEGYVFQITRMGGKKQEVNSYKWVPKLNSKPVRTFWEGR